MLYIIATPIGNLKDITYRAIETLQIVDRIYAEDTRHTRTLLQHYGIRTPLFTYHDHSNAAERQAIVAFLQAGNQAALVSDAGTPLIADPGYKLVRDVQEAGVEVSSCPGASAVITALSIAGLPTDQFYFHGFVPPKAQALEVLCSTLAPEITHVFYARMSRVPAMIACLRAQHKVGNMSIARELTKQFEEIITAPISTIEMPKTAKGEVVILLRLEGQESTQDPQEILHQLLQDHSVKDSVAMAYEMFSMPKKQLYHMALEITNGKA